MMIEPVEVTPVVPKIWTGKGRIYFLRSRNLHDDGTELFKMEILTLNASSRINHHLLNSRMVHVQSREQWSLREFYIIPQVVQYIPSK